MGLGSFTVDPDDDAIESYRNKDVSAAVQEANLLAPELLRPAAPERRQHMLRVLKWVLVYVDEGFVIHQAKLHAFDRTADADEFDIEDSTTLATEVQQAYKDRKEGEGVQELFEDGLKQFVDIWERQQEMC